MNALAPYIAALHQQNLLEQAELGRRVRLVQGEPRVSALRRGLGVGARGLARLFSSAARTLDPTHGERTSARSTDGRGARAMAA